MAERARAAGTLGPPRGLGPAHRNQDRPAARTRATRTCVRAPSQVAERDPGVRRDAAADRARGRIRPLRKAAERRVNEVLVGYSVRIGGLSLNVFGLGVDLLDVAIVQTSHPDPPIAALERFGATIQWGALLSGDVVGDLVVDPRASFSTRRRCSPRPTTRRTCRIVAGKMFDSGRIRFDGDAALTADADRTPLRGPADRRHAFGRRQRRGRGEDAQGRPVENHPKASSAASAACSRTGRATRWRPAPGRSSSAWCRTRSCARSCPASSRRRNAAEPGRPRDRDVGLLRPPNTLVFARRA